MIHILCIRPHLRTVVSIENSSRSDFWKNEENYARDIDIKLQGKGIDSSRILTKINIPNILLSLINRQTRHVILEKLNNENIEVLEIPTEMGSQISVEVIGDKQRNVFLPPFFPIENEIDKIESQIMRLTKFDVLIIPCELDYDLMLSICQICEDNMINFYFDYQDHYNLEILSTNPFLISITFKQISKILKQKVDDGNIFKCMDDLVDLGIENLIIIEKNSIFIKFKNSIFSVYAEGFSEMNQTINKEMLIACFIGLLATTPDVKKAINEAISIVRDFTFKISTNFIYKTSEKINDLFKKLETKNTHEDEENFMDLSLYWNTKEILFVISESLIKNEFTKNLIIKKINNFFKTNQVRTRTGNDNCYFHIKMYENGFPINDLTKLELIAKNNKSTFINIIKGILPN